MIAVMLLNAFNQSPWLWAGTVSCRSGAASCPSQNLSKQLIIPLIPLCFSIVPMHVSVALRAWISWHQKLTLSNSATHRTCHTVLAQCARPIFADTYSLVIACWYMCP